MVHTSLQDLSWHSSFLINVFLSRTNVLDQRSKVKVLNSRALWPPTSKGSRWAWSWRPRTEPTLNSSALPRWPTYRTDGSWSILTDGPTISTTGVVQSPQTSTQWAGATEWVCHFSPLRVRCGGGEGGEGGLHSSVWETCVHAWLSLVTILLY